MTDATDRYALPLLQTAQAQKEITHNAALGLIDTLLQLAVEDIIPAPPATPLTGQGWIVGSGATGIWAGRDGQIAAFTAAGWSYIAPRDGCLAWVRAAGVFAILRSGSWQAGAWPVRTLAVNGRTMLGASVVPLISPAGGSVIDTEARAAINAIAGILRSMGLASA